MKKKLLCSVIGSTVLFGGVTANVSALVLEEVVVTAQKRSQNVNDIGMSITAYSGDTLNQLGVSGTDDLAVITPGLTYTDSGAGTPVYTMRGIGFNESSLQSTSTVGVYNDEVATPFPVMTNGPLMDIERVEILKGPQGTLYGRNTTGGAINYIVNKPTEDFEAGTTLGYGNFNTSEVEGFVSGPLGDSVSARLSFKTTQSSEGWQHSVSRDDKLGEQDKTGVRLLVAADITADIDALLSINVWRDKSDSLAPQAIQQSYQKATNTAITDKMEQYWSIDSSNDSSAADWTEGYDHKVNLESQAVSFTLNWQFNDNLKLTSLTSMSKFEDDGSIYNRDGWGGAPVSDPEIEDLITKLSVDGGFTPESHLRNSGYTQAADIDAFSQELRLSGDTDQLTWLAGIYYSSDEIDSTTFFESGLASNTNNAGGAFGGFQALNYLTNQDGQSWSVFANTEWNLSDQLKLTVGARHTRDEKDFEGCTSDIYGDMSVLFATVFGSGAVPGDCITLLADTTPFTSGLTRNSIDEDSTSGKVALDYIVNDDSMVYLSYSRGFKSGSFPSLAATTGVQLDPVVQEKLIAYELGFKTALFDGSAQLNAAAFYYDYADKQLLTKIPSIFGSIFTLANVPESDVHGVEFDLQMQPMEGLFVSLGGSYLDTEVKDFTGYTQTGLTAVDLSGSEFPFTPSVQFTAIVDYERPVSDKLIGFIGGDISYSGSSQTDYASKEAPLNSVFELDSYTVVGLRIGVRSTDETWSASLWGRNVTDEFYANNILKSTDSIIRFNGMPATYGATFSYNWF